MSGGQFSRLSAAAVCDPNLSAEAKIVLAAISIFADKDGRCFPALTTIAKMLKCYRRTIQRHLRKLESAGYITTERAIRRTRGGWGRSRYRLHYPIASLPKISDDDATPDAASISADATPHAASKPVAMRRRMAVDATPGVAGDAAPHAAQTSPINSPMKNRRTRENENDDGEAKFTVQKPSKGISATPNRHSADVIALLPKADRYEGLSAEDRMWSRRMREASAVSHKKYLEVLDAFIAETSGAKR